MNFIINRKRFVNFASYASHYELPKRHNHPVSAKYGVAKFSHLNFALHGAYTPSRRLWRLDTPLINGIATLSDGVLNSYNQTSMIQQAHTM